MPQLTSIAPTTELEAVNEMLAAIGEEPISNLDTETRVDVEIAVNFLRSNIREVLTVGWKFNTDFEWRIAKDGNNKFPVPSQPDSTTWEMLAFNVTKRVDQQGDLPEKQEDGTFSTTPTRLDIVRRGLFFYDRIQNKFDFGDATDRPQIFIDIVWSMDFTDMPETARKYIVVRSTRQFCGRLLDSPNRVKYTEQDELQALLNLRKDQKPDRQRNIINNADVARALGGRPRSGVTGRLKGYA
jgi:hypothetical protein